MYAIGRRSRHNPNAIRLVVDQSQPSSAGKSAAILQFTSKRAAEQGARERGEWFFVVTLGMVTAAKRAAKKTVRKAARKAVKGRRR